MTFEAEYAKRWLRLFTELEPGPVWFNIEELRELWAGRSYYDNFIGHVSAPSLTSDADLKLALRELVDERVLDTGTIFGKKRWRTKSLQESLRGA